MPMGSKASLVTLSWAADMFQKPNDGEARDAL
jgi:hypothetical protein